MQVKELKSKGLVKEFEVVVLSADLEKAIDKELHKIANKVKIDGFRPGKAPMDVVRKRFEDQIIGDALQEAVAASVNSLVDEQKMKLALQPKIKLDKFERGKDITYQVELEAMPEIKPVDFATLKLQKLKAEPTDEAVAETLKQIAETHKVSQKIADDRAARLGDIVTINFDGTVDGVAHKGMKADNYELELGSKSFIDTFEDQIVGLKVGAKKDVKVKFPENYGAKELAGKDAVFAIELKQIGQKVVPDANDDLAKKMGFDSLDALKTAIKEHLEKEYNQLAKMHLKRKLLDKLDEMHKFPLPPTLVDMEFDAIWKRLEENRKHGMVDEDEKGKSEDVLKKEYREIAERRVKLALLLAEVGNANKLAITKEELNRAVYAESMKYRTNIKDVMNFYKNNPQALDQLKAPLLEDKAISFILELAEVEDKVVPIDELTKSVEE